MANKTEAEKIEKEAASLTEKILKMLGVKAGVQAVVEDDLVKIKIDGEDLGLLIGHRGENLESLQLLLGIMLNKQIDEQSWRPVLVDVGGWRAQREDELRILVAREAVKLTPERDFVELSPMPPAQRRAVHLLVKQYDGLTSESTGDGLSRRVVIKMIKKS